MHRVSLDNCRFGNRQKTIRQSPERLKVFQRPPHAASMILLLLVCLLSSPIQAQIRKADQQGAQPNRTQEQTLPEPTIGQEVVNTSLNTGSAQQNQSYVDQWIEKARADPMFGVTVILAVIALVQVGVYQAIHSTTRRAERAYIGIVDHEGIVFKRFDQHSVVALVNFAAANNGRTPAHVTDAIVNIELLRPEDSLPNPPAYQRVNLRERTTAFLVSRTRICRIEYSPDQRTTDGGYASRLALGGVWVH